MRVWEEAGAVRGPTPWWVEDHEDQSGSRAGVCGETPWCQGDQASVGEHAEGAHLPRGGRLLHVQVVGLSSRIRYVQSPDQTYRDSSLLPVTGVHSPTLIFRHPDIM